MKKTAKMMVSSDSQVTVATINSDTSITTATDTVVVNATDTGVTSPAISPKKEVKNKKNQKKAEKEKKTSKTEKDKSTKKLVVKKKSEKVTKEEPKKEVVSARDKMFPKEITVHGVKFTRIENEDIEKASVKNITQLISSHFNNGDAIMLGYNTPKELLTPKGKRKASDYERFNGIKPPAEFPHDVEMCLIDAVLPINAKQILSHSIYTEFAGITPFETFDKRAKDGYFISADDIQVPLEVYIADYENADDKVEGSFINLYDDENAEENK